MPIFDTLDGAGWNPITAATAADSTEILERFGPDSSGAIYFVLRAVNAGTGTVTVASSNLGWTTNPNVTVTSLYGTAPGTSYDGNGNLVLSFGSISALDDRVVKIVYNGTPTVPVANFSASPTSGAPPLNVSFTDSSTQSPTAWYWDFGDGNTSTVQSPSHTYSSSGQYIVSLTASNASGQTTALKDNYITANAAPAANFIYDRVKGVLAQEPNGDCVAYFRDRSTNTPTAWSWNFGDGGTDTTQNPTHTYTTSGVFTVSLKATNASGNNTCTMTNLVNIMALKADFTADNVFGTAPLTVNFTDESSGSPNPTAWSWTFGDGGTSTAQNPSHTYTSTGYDTVALTAYNSGGSNTMTKTNYIAVCYEAVLYPTTLSMSYPSGGNQYYTGTAADLQTEDGRCVVLYPDTTGHGIADCAYMNFTAPSSYPQSQVVAVTGDLRYMTSDAGDTISRPSWDRPSCTIYPAPSQLTDYSFTVVSGQAFSGASVVMTLCNSPDLTHIPIAISVDRVRFHLYLKPGGGAPPAASFTGTPTSGTAPLAVTFTDTSTGSPTAWMWNFGDSNYATTQNPSHTYTSGGSFTVTLTSYNQYGSTTCTTSNYITVSGSPTASFTGTPDIGGIPLAVSFTDTSTGSPTAWSWTFGDTYTSTAQNPSHTYTDDRYVPGGADGDQLPWEQHLHHTQLHHHGQCAGGQLLRDAHLGRGAADGAIHGLRDELSDLLVLGLRRPEQFHESEPEPYVHVGRVLYGGVERVQPVRPEHLHQEQLHHGFRERGSGGELHRHADHRRAAAGGELHGHLHGQPDRVVVDLRRRREFHRSEPEPHVHHDRSLHRRADRVQPVRQ